MASGYTCEQAWTAASFRPPAHNPRASGEDPDRIEYRMLITIDYLEVSVFGDLTPFRVPPRVGGEAR